MTADLKKKRLQALIFYTVLFILSVIGIIVTTFIGLTLNPESPEVPNLMVFQAMMFILAFFTGMEAWKYYNIKIPEIRLIELIKCSGCGYVETRMPKKGDYVFKKVGKCLKCGGELYIESILREVKNVKAGR